MILGLEPQEPRFFARGHLRIEAGAVAAVTVEPVGFPAQLVVGHVPDGMSFHRHLAFPSSDSGFPGATFVDATGQAQAFIAPESVFI